MKEIYLDNAATTAVIPCALAAAEKAMQICYGNAGSVHGKGREASAILQSSRNIIAKTLGCDAGCITFTSGGTEST
ncbi:MAG: aminotransferase class V-fold PLP-dependent enzyme, partial [Clostridia bacterium]|nr:aminotransferase class V-fold PLP-dependent enzyme [Clostridia bacterium]